MLSIDLFDSRYEKKLHEGALDNTITRTQAHLMEPLSRRAADIRTQIRSGKLSGAELDKLEKEYEDLVQKRLDIMLDRQPKNEQQVPSKQDPFAYVKPEPKGIGDIQDPRAKMAQLAQRAKKGPLANVGAGIKGFLTGKEEPLDEEQELGRRGIGMANMKALQATVEKGFARTIFQFPTGKYVVGEDDTDKMADYYNGQDAAGRTNFVYNVLGDGMKFIQMCKQLGIQAAPVEPQQPELPGMPQVSPQGQLPLSEKKKSNSDDLKAGDVKTAREIQKIRAQYPAARSDIEALARAEIDSTERSQQQIGRIRSSNSRQDELIKQIMDIDREQSQEIDSIDSENNNLEQQLDRVQSLNDRLTQAVAQMAGTKKSSQPAVQKTTTQTGGATIDLIPGAPADQQKVVPMRKPEVKPAVATDAGKQGTEPAPVLPTNVVQFSKYSPPEQLVKAPKVSGSDIREHGGGIGPRQHWQSMMPEGQPQELIHRYLAIDAETDVDAVRKAIQAISRDSALSATSKSRLLGQIGMIIKRHKLPIGRAYYQFMQQFMEAVELDRARIAGYPNDPGTAKHRLDTAKAILSDPRSDADSRREATGIVAKLDKKVVAETVTDVRPLWAKAYHRLAPKIERHRDSFLAGQLYDELENIAELHGAEGEFKRMMSTARNRAHMEYDTNPGGFQNWFWFLPFEDQDVAEGTDDIKKKMSKLEALALAANRAGDDAKCKMYQQKIQSLKQKLSQSMAEGWSDQGNPTPYSVYIDGREWRAYKSDDHARAVAEKVRANLKKQGREQTVTIAPSKAKRVQEDFGMPGTTIPHKSLIQGYTVFWNPKTQVVSVTRGGDSEEAAIEQARVGTPSLKNFRQAADRLIDRIESDLNEAKEIVTKNDFLDRRDYLLRKIDADPNPVNKQIIRAEIRKLESQAEAEGWITMPQRLVREDSDGGEAVEMAIMRRMLVAHTDLIVEFGLDKVVQAIEEVAYNVGDTDEIGSSDVSGWVNQVKQILGADA
jgi:hypothetical protein